MTSYGYGHGSRADHRGGVCEGLRNTRGNGGGLGFPDGHGYGDSLGCSIDTAYGHGSGSGTGRTKGTNYGRYAYDDSDGTRALCPVKGQTVYVVTSTVFETKFSNEIEVFWFTRQEAEAALAVRLLGKDD